MGVKQIRRWTFAVAIAAAGFCCCGAVVFQLILSLNEEIRPTGIFYWSSLFLSVAGMCFLGLLSLVSMDILHLKPADSLPFATLRASYVTLKKAHYYGLRCHRQFLKGCMEVPAIQEDYLLSLLNHNKDTAYGKDYKFEEIRSIKDFQKCHPLIRHHHIKAYIDRLTEGERNILTKEHPLYFAKTSGTTGQPKLVPITAYLYLRKNYVKNLNYGFAYGPVSVGAKLTLGKAVQLGHKPQVDTTKSGLLAAPLTYFYLNPTPANTSPKSAFSITHENTSFYVHALFALQEKEVGVLILLFAHQAYSFFTFVEEHWSELCSDIQHGVLSRDGLTIEDAIYDDIAIHMKSDCERADELRKEFKKGPVRLAKRLWPDLEYCFVTTTGSMAVYAEFIQKTYLKDVILNQNGYGASEGFYGMNFPAVTHDCNYLLAYSYCFFEFIPENQIEEEQPSTVLAQEVTQGQSYELVITNGTGFCRYRTEDVVRITQFIAKCPVMEFQYRIGQILNLLGEKTTHTVFYKALRKATEHLGVTLIDYTTCEDIHLQEITEIDGYTRRYVLFIELDRKLSEEETKQFDQSLCEESSIYAGMRKNRQSVTAMEVIQLKPGSFRKLKDHMTQQSRNPQFKMPRSLRVKQHLAFLLDQRLTSSGQC